MADEKYDGNEHTRAIDDSTANEAMLHKQIKNSLNDIWDEIKSVHADVESLKNRRPSRSRTLGGSGAGDDDSPLEYALEDGLRARGVPKAAAEATARATADKIRDSVRDNDGEVTEAELANAVRSVPVEGTEELGAFADAVAESVASAAFEPGRDLPHDTSRLDEARQLLATAATTAGSEAASLSSPPPSIASSEIMRDVSHLTSLLLGSSPAFAEAMRMQSDAIAYSLAAFNKVGDMQRQDAIGLAITARAAASKFDPH